MLSAREVISIHLTKINIHTPCYKADFSLVKGEGNYVVWIFTVEIRKVSLARQRVMHVNKKGFVLDMALKKIRVEN